MEKSGEAWNLEVVNQLPKLAKSYARWGKWKGGRQEACKVGLSAVKIEMAVNKSVYICVCVYVYRISRIRLEISIIIFFFFSMHIQFKYLQYIPLILNFLYFLHCR